MKKIILAIAALSLSTGAFAMGSTSAVPKPTPEQAGVIGAREVTAIKAEAAKAINRRNVVSTELKSQTSQKYGALVVASSMIDEAVKVKNRYVFDLEVERIHTLTTELCAAMSGC